MLGLNKILTNLLILNLFIELFFISNTYGLAYFKDKPQRITSDLIVLSSNNFEINETNPINKKENIDERKNLDNNNNNNLKPFDFFLGFFSGILSGILVWFLTKIWEMRQANKFFPYLREILIKEIDIFYSILKNNVNKGPKEYSEILKERVSYLEDSTNKIIENYNWLMEKMDVRKASLIIEIKPLIRDWLNFIEGKENASELILNYFLDEQINKENKLYVEVKQLKDKLDSYRRKLLR